MAVFIDASFAIALADPKDQWHAAAKRALPAVRKAGALHTHVLAVAEVVAVIASAHGGTRARDAFEAMVDDHVVHYPTPEDVQASMRRVVRFDGALSLSDAYALQVMEAHGLRAIASFDAGFDGKGVVRIR